MEKELVNGSSVLKTSFSHLKPWKKGAKATDRFVWVSILGLPLIGWNHICIESIIEKAGKMVGYDITSVSQGSLTGVKVLLSTTSFETLNEHVLLVLDGDEFDISIMEMKPDFCPILSTIKHSMDITATLDEESCSDFATSDEVTAAGLKTTDPGGDRCATDITITEQQKTGVDSDFSLIFCQGHTGKTNNWDHTDTISKNACLFPETDETHNLQTIDQQLHNDTYQPPPAMSHDNRLKENMQEAADSDSSIDVSVQSVTGVGIEKKGITGQVKGTRLSNTSSAQVLRSSSKTARTLNLDQNQLQNSYSDFIRDLAEPQEVVDMELKERKRKKLRQIRRIGTKYTGIKRKKVKKNRHALANRGLADVAPDSYKNKYLKDNSSSPAIKSSSDKHADITSNHASMATETSDAQTSLPSPLSSQCSQQASSEAIKENNRNARSKTRKLKLLQASGSVANTTEKGVSSDSLNSGIKQGNVRFEAAYKDNQADGFDRVKETREMLHDAAALGLGIYQDLIGYEEGVRGNIDREVEEWTSANQL
jgi:hypothetical protein